LEHVKNFEELKSKLEMQPPLEMNAAEKEQPLIKPEMGLNSYTVS
jgi:hypothetical protein